MVKLVNSHVTHFKALQHESIDGSKPISATIVCKSHEASQHVALWFQKNGVEATAKDRGNDVQLRSTFSLLGKLFATEFHRYTFNNMNYHSNSCEIDIPDELENDIVAVLGLNSMPMFGPACLRQQQTATVKPRANASALSQFSPATIAKLYQFPTADGQGQSIGIVELGGAFFQSDLDAYFAALSLPSPAPTVRVVLVDGATQNDDDASVEVALDVDVIAAIVPKATITIYFAENSMQGFYRAIQVAGQQNSIVSVSWGLDESSGLNIGGYVASYQSLFQSLGATILVSSGDSGSAGDSGFGKHVGFPASVPGCLACGGTTLVSNGTTITSERAWNGSGGGYSVLYAKPSYQAGVVSGSARGVPDLSGNADPATGYAVRYKSQQITIGGTSAVSPLFAALTAQLNQLSGKTLGVANGTLYTLAGTAAFRDVASGNNGGFTAVAGWDPVTGLGVPHGTNLLAALLTPPAPLPPPSPPTLRITSISPASGPLAGGTVVTISGQNLASVTSIKVANANATITSKTDSTLQFSTPAQTIAGAATVLLTNGTGSASTSFTYVAPPPPPPQPRLRQVVPSIGSRGGGTTVRISGANLQNVSSVFFGTAAATIVSKSATLVTVRTPRAMRAQVVTATLSFAAPTAKSLAFSFRYV